MASPGNSLPKDLFRHTPRVDIRGVKQVDTRVKAYIHKTRSFGDIAAAPCLEEFGSATKRPGPKAKNRPLQTGMTKLSVFHTQRMLRSTAW
jgi:hypothetical protein